MESYASGQSMLEAACKELACQPRVFIQSGKEGSNLEPDMANRKRRAEDSSWPRVTELLDLSLPGFLDAIDFAILIYYSIS